MPCRLEGLELTPAESYLYNIVVATDPFIEWDKEDCPLLVRQERQLCQSQKSPTEPEKVRQILAAKF